MKQLFKLALIFAILWRCLPSYGQHAKIDPMLKLANYSKYPGLLQNGHESVSSKLKTSSVAFAPIAHSLGVDTYKTDPEIPIIMEYGGDVSVLKNHGLVIGSIIGPFLTATMPLSQLDVVSKLEGVREIELAKPLERHSNVASQIIRADLARQSTPFRGNGIVVGFVDSGIDWSHPTFDEADGSSTRILSIWDQKVKNSTPPPGFAYGKEWTRDQINNGMITHTDQSGHGTHVAGIAVGNGQSATGQTPYIGVAPEADIIMVTNTLNNNGQVLINIRSNEVLDGIRYIANKAKSFGKPWVVNLSLGMDYGPRNGNSLFEKAVNELASNQTYGEGRVIVTSAGNDGVVQSDPNANPLNQIHTSSNQSGSKEFFINSDAFSVNIIGIEIYYPPTSNYTVRITSPLNNSYIVSKGGYFVPTNTTDGFIFMDNYNSPYDSGGEIVIIFPC